ncbi:Senescence-associated subtilisin protease [Rhynchospora pubera]|uniref:Senescence-associated subtilisin protease n=1 Tax=Rhynchospora pubera TaxID=906938 RepID=A0AAV8C0A6_9POAL|nr:Senescence-associated subtilisin protease [Rhynchospora pubera]
MAIQYLFSLLILCLLTISASSQSETRSTYIIHLAPSLSQTRTRSHPPLHSLLPSRLRHPSPRHLYTYTLSAYGYAALLTPSQARYLESHRSVLSIQPDQVRHPHTTHTPSFLKLSLSGGLWPQSNLAEETIVAVLDTGIWPERPCFACDDSFPSPPSKWKGECVSTGSFNASQFCSNKLIGAKFFAKGYEAAMGHPIDESSESRSPLDTEGHGTHTASTAAGTISPDAGFYEYARGEARGIATQARIAAYKICWLSGCYDSDILAAMDEAVSDGADVISLSVGSSGYAPQFYRDSIAIGAFGAVRHGLVVSCSAGNSGPGRYTAVNIAPWILTVGASTVDRDFPADVILGDGTSYTGVSLYAGDPLNSTELPLVYAADAGSRLCITGYLNSSMVKDKIVVCDRGGNARVAKGSAVKQAGGIGMILANTEDSGEELIADSHLVPATMVGQTAGDKIKKYIKSVTSPTATIVFRGTVIGSSPSAPRVAAFSSRGPNYRAPEILKPDVIAPGVNILAGWTGASSPTDLDIDPRRVEFNIISGTSMSCPHVSGIAALLKSARPDWSPAAIKSALMTTAYNLDNSGEIIKDLATGEESTPFVRGAGHVDPNKALDPGLVYDSGIEDYIAFLCSIGYASFQISVFTRDGSTTNCSAVALATPGNLNYPAFSVVLSSYTDVVTYHRTVTNVGSSGSAVYEATVSSPDGVKVTVVPSKLEFSTVGESLSYEITFSGIADPVIITESNSFGSITWSDGIHNVSSPIAVSWQKSFVSSM